MKLKGNALIMISVLLILIVISIFYWFEYKPNYIISNCLDAAMEDGRTLLQSKTIYHWCLEESGLKK